MAKCRGVFNTPSPESRAYSQSEWNGAKRTDSRNLDLIRSTRLQRERKLHDDTGRIENKGGFPSKKDSRPLCNSAHTGPRDCLRFAMEKSPCPVPREFRVNPRWPPCQTLAYEFAFVGATLSGLEESILATLTRARAVLPRIERNDSSQLRLWRPTSAPPFTALGSAA